MIPLFWRYIYSDFGQVVGLIAHQRVQIWMIHYTSERTIALIHRIISVQAPLLLSHAKSLREQQHI